MGSSASRKDKVVTISDIVNYISKDLGIMKEDARKVVNSLFDYIAYSLYGEGKDVIINKRFKLHAIPVRMSRRKINGQVMVVPLHYKVTVIKSKALLKNLGGKK
jgi:nucleoid DNA-binding protein